jgi:hypothetical protein
VLCGGLVGLDRSREGNESWAHGVLEGGLRITGISVRGNSSLGYGGLKFEHENYTQFEVQENIGSKGKE